MLDLTGKRAMVCGSTQGIGKASAMQLAKQGASVTLVARNEDALKKIPYANIAHLENNTVKHAELLTINPDGIDLSEMKI